MINFILSIFFHICAKNEKKAKASTIQNKSHDVPNINPPLLNEDLPFLNDELNEIRGRIERVKQSIDRVQQNTPTIYPTITVVPRSLNQPTFKTIATNFIKMLLA